jgi:hypothetical protein
VARCVALFRPRDPAAMPHILKLIEDSLGRRAVLAVRGLAPAMVDGPKMERVEATRRLRTIVNGDPDRRVRTEALRVIVQYDDENAFGVVVNYPGCQRHLAVGLGGRGRAAVQVPSGRDGVAGERILRQVQALALRITALTPLTTFQPAAAAELAGALLATDSVAARNARFRPSAAPAPLVAPSSTSSPRIQQWPSTRRR